MKINDKNGLLKVDETISSLLEELAQEANGPELDGAGELDNEATLEKEPTINAGEITNQDIYNGENEEMSEEVAEKIIESLSNMSDLELMELIKESGNEANLENLSILKEEIACASDTILNEGKLLNFFKKMGSLALILPALWGAGSGMHKLATANSDYSDKLTSNLTTVQQNAYDDYKDQTIKDAENEHNAKEDEAEAAYNTDDAYNARKKAYDDETAQLQADHFIKQGQLQAAHDAEQAALPEAERTPYVVEPFEGRDPYPSQDEDKYQRKEFDPDTVKFDYPDAKSYSKTGNNGFKAQMKSHIKNIDINPFADDIRGYTPKEKMAVGGVQAAAGLGALGAMAVNARNKRKKREEEAEGKNRSSTADYARQIFREASDIELMEYLQKNGYEATLENLLILKEELENVNEDILDGEAPNVIEAEENGATEKNAPVGAEEKREEKSDLENADTTEDKSDDEVKESEKEQTNENALFDFINSINESLAQEANGPELDGEGELKNEATEEKEPKTEKADTDNEDVYCDGCHKQVEDVVEVVVEAVAACKANGVPATLENITEAAASLFETKNFDIDAFINSKEMNGSSKFDEYEKIEGDGANAALTGLRETKSYKSLKEACMMDDGYFTEDSYTVETAAEKTAKLTEQVSLLIARENNDPLYDELLKESAYCMRLREQIQNKYNRSAISKVNDITK